MNVISHGGQIINGPENRFGGAVQGRNQHNGADIHQVSEHARNEKGIHIGRGMVQFGYQSMRRMR